MVPRTGAHSCVGCRGSGSLRIVGRGRLPLGTAPGGLGCCGKAQWVLIAGSLLLLPAQVCRRAAVAAFSAFPKLFFFFFSSRKAIAAAAPATLPDPPYRTHQNMGNSRMKSKELCVWTQSISSLLSPSLFCFRQHTVSLCHGTCAFPHALSKNGQPLDAALYSRINCGDFLIARKINK